MRTSLGRTAVITAGAALAGTATVLGLQLLLAARVERAALKRLGQQTSLNLRLAELALERLPRDGVAQLSGLELAARPPRMERGSIPGRMAQQAGQLHSELCQQLGTCPRQVVQGLPRPGVWVELPSALEPAWLFTPLPRARLWPAPLPVLSIGLLAAGLVATSLLLELEVRRPLARLRQWVNGVDLNTRPAPLAEEGTSAVRGLTQRFNAMLERLEQGRRERATMLAGIAHDLRSPITRLQLRLAKASERPLGAEEAERAQADLDAISHITGQFMAYASGSITEPVVELNLADLVGEAVAGLAAPLQLELMDLRRRVRPTALARAVANLAENAVAHGRAPLRISLSSPAGEVDGFLITVADCGPGIPPERWGQALEPFQRLDPARGGSGHCGLGLAIAREVAASHGGELWCEQLPPTPEAPQGFAVVFRGRSQPVTT